MKPTRLTAEIVNTLDANKCLDVWYNDNMGFDMVKELQKFIHVRMDRGWAVRDPNDWNIYIAEFEPKMMAPPKYNELCAINTKGRASAEYTVEMVNTVMEFCKEGKLKLKQ